MANNEMQWSSAAPGLLIILLDQSGSMLLTYDGEDTRTVFASKAVNRVINTLIQKNFDGKVPKDRCFIVVIGYNDEVKKIVSGFLKTLDANPIRIDTIKKKISDGDGGLIEIESKMPIWVEPIEDDHWTNMTKAFVMAKEIITQWLGDKPNNPAPVIINISDGLPYYDGRAIEDCMVETIQVVNDIKSIDIADGKIQIFNAMIGDGEKVVFPSSNAELNSLEACFLYEISTEIPEAYRGAAEKNELAYKAGSRGAIYQADAEHLIKLIDFGSSKGQGDK